MSDLIFSLARTHERKREWNFSSLFCVCVLSTENVETDTPEEDHLFTTHVSILCFRVCIVHDSSSASCCLYHIHISYIQYSLL
jgi:hypothetical protein